MKVETRKESAAAARQQVTVRVMVGPVGRGPGSKRGRTRPPPDSEHRTVTVKLAGSHGASARDMPVQTEWLK